MTKRAIIYHHYLFYNKVEVNDFKAAVFFFAESCLNPEEKIYRTQTSKLYRSLLIV